MQKKKVCEILYVVFGEPWSGNRKKALVRTEMCFWKRIEDKDAMHFKKFFELVLLHETFLSGAYSSHFIDSSTFLGSSKTAKRKFMTSVE